MALAVSCGKDNKPGNDDPGKYGVDGKTPMPEAVDIGLVVNGKTIKWASFNLGASKEYEYGDYYAWGETVTKSVYDWSTYAPGGSTLSSENACGTSADLIYQQCGGKNADVSGTKYDVAFVKWGSKWKTPTNAQHRDRA